MDVYYNGNGNIWGKGKAKDKMTAFPLNRTLMWGERPLFLPSLYINEKGVILDVCSSFPVEDMMSFLEKWNEERRLSLKTHEDYEEMEADHPALRHFEADMRIDGHALTSRMSGSLVWYPEDFLLANAEDWKNEEDSETLMENYGCDRTLCWHLERLIFLWKEEPIWSPRELSLTFRSHEHSITTEYFTTGGSMSPDSLPMTIRTRHPQTKREYILTIHECEQTRHDLSNIGEKGLQYPEYCQILSYSISPEIAPHLVDIRDCAEGDSPRKIGADNFRNSCEITSSENGKTADGPTAVFVAGKSGMAGRHMASSALHFRPISEVKWRIVFRVKPIEDMTVIVLFE